MCPPIDTTTFASRTFLFTLLPRHYFGVSFYYPYVILWMRKVGLSNSSVGGINTMRSLATMFCVPLWGMVADRFNTKTVLLVLVCFATLLRFSTIQCTSFCEKLNYNLNPDPKP